MWALRGWMLDGQAVKPHVVVTYNGDGVDWPFVECRALKNGIHLYATNRCWDESGSAVTTTFLLES